MLAGEWGPLFPCCSTGVTGVGVRTSTGCLFIPVFRMHMAPWWSHSVARVASGHHHTVFSTWASCYPVLLPTLVPQFSWLTHCPLCLSWASHQGHLVLQTAYLTGAPPTLCPRAGHQLCLMYLLGLHRGASCLLRTADQLWPGKPLLCHPVGLAIPSLMMSLKPILGENLNPGEMVLFQDCLSLHNVPQSYSTI